MAAIFAKAANQARFRGDAAAQAGEPEQAPMTEPDPVDASPVPQSPEPAPVSEYLLAAQLAARMCHDFISPAGAIVSGLDLLEDPSAQDMREDAMSLITASAKKLVALLSFDRVAFGGSASAESFDTRELERLTRDVYAHGRATLEWSVEPESLAKPAARAVLNLAQIGSGALPIGGLVKVVVTAIPGETLLSAHATGARARLRPEVGDGLNGAPLGEGLGGHWVQAYFLKSLVDEAGGSLDVTLAEEEVVVRVRLPA
jgi:histidine phosphotransferase ChpT